jgi:hypothetical protein
MAATIGVTILLVKAQEFADQMAELSLTQLKRGFDMQ